MFLDLYKKRIFVDTYFHLLIRKTLVLFLKHNALMLQMCSLLEDDLPISLTEDIVTAVTPRLLQSQWLATRYASFVLTRFYLL